MKSFKPCRSRHSNAAKHFTYLPNPFTQLSFRPDEDVPHKLENVDTVRCCWVAWVGGGRTSFATGRPSPSYTPLQYAGSHTYVREYLNIHAHEKWPFHCAQPVFSFASAMIIRPFAHRKAYASAKVLQNNFW